MLFEIKRKSFHIVTGLASAVLVYIGQYPFWPVTALLGVGILTSLRSRKHTLPLVSSLIAELERDKHQNKLPGKAVLAAIAGILLVQVLFPPLYATSSIIALAVGDPAACFIGKQYGRVKIPGTSGKTVSGTAGCFIVIALFNCLLLSIIPAIVGGFFGSLFELLTPTNNIYIDDNITIPFGVGVGSYLIFLFI